MAHTDISVEEAVVKILERSGSCSLDDLVAQLPDHKWSKVFAAVDAMSRDGRLSLRPLARAGYRISLPSPKPVYAEMRP
jgi:3-methyladenine DNA glycosylase AlkC